MMIHSQSTADWVTWKQSPQRWLAVDVGDATLGIALSDSTRLVASPLRTLTRRSMAKDSQALAAVIAEHSGGLCVVGWPLHLDGTEGPQCAKVMAFLKHLSRRSHVPILLWDERWTTKVVERTMITADLSRKRRNQVVDHVAACYLLQGVLDYARAHAMQPPAGVS